MPVSRTLDVPILPSPIDRSYELLLKVHRTLKESSEVMRSKYLSFLHQQVLAAAKETAAEAALCQVLPSIDLDSVTRYESGDQSVLLDLTYCTAKVAWDRKAALARTNKQASELSAHLQGIVSEVAPLEGIPIIPDHNLEQLAYGVRSDLWERHVERVSALGTRRVAPVTTMLGVHASLVSCGHCHFFSLNGVGIAMSWPVVLMLADMAQSRYRLSVSVPYLLSSAAWSVLRRQLAWQDKVVSMYGNPGYELVKAPETLCRAYVTKLTTRLGVLGSKSYSDMIAKVGEKERKMSGLDTTPLVDEYVDLLEAQTDIDTVMMMFGVVKSSGFPIVDPELGGRSAQAHAKQEDSSSLYACYETSWCLRHELLCGYLAKHGRWPPLSFSKEGSQLETLRIRGSPVLAMGDYPLSDWSSASFEKFIEFDFYPSYLELLDDKSVGIPMDEVLAQVEPGFAAPKQKTPRRLLLDALSRRTIDTRAIIEKGSRGEWDQDQRAIRLAPKEEEHKIAPRMFCILPLEPRLFFSISEANVKEAFKYLQTQTMTMDRIELNKRFDADSQLFDDPKIIKLFLEIDLTRWNLLWRRFIMLLIGRVFDEAFGMPGTFTNSHDFFEKAQVYVAADGVTHSSGVVPVDPFTECDPSILEKLSIMPLGGDLLVLYPANKRLGVLCHSAWFSRTPDESAPFGERIKRERGNIVPSGSREGIDMELLQGLDVHRDAKGQYVIYPEPREIKVRENALKPSDTAWTGHLGGFEGIIQKLWTAATGAAIARAMLGLNVSYSLSGQGDNQVATITAPVSVNRAEEAARLASEVLRRTERAFSEIGQIVKVDECVVSDTVISYSKRFWVEGRQVESAIKPIARARWNGDMLDHGLASKIASLQAQMLSAADSSAEPLKVWALSVFFSHELAARCMAQGWGCGRYKPGVISVVAPALIVVPPLIGGVSAVTWCSYLARGTSDPLSASLVSVQPFRDPAVRAIDGLIESDAGYDRVIDLTGLISDPYAIPFTGPDRPGNPFEFFVRSRVGGMCQNAEIRPLINLASARGDKLLLLGLASMRPLLPLVAHDIYESSVERAALTCVGMFEHSTTLMTMIREDPTLNADHMADIYASRVMEAFVEFVTRAVKLKAWRPAGVRGDVFQRCERARERWGVGQLVGVTTHHPLDQKIVTPTCADDGYLLVSRVSGKPAKETRGPSRVYYGSATREKRGDHGIKLVSKDPPALAAKKLMITRSQILNDGALSQTIDFLAAERVGMSAEDLRVLMPHVFGGVAAHRYDSMSSRKNFSLMGQPTHASHVKLSSDRFAPISGSSDDYPVAVQEWAVTAIGLFGLICSQNSSTVPRSIMIKAPSKLVAMHCESVKGGAVSFGVRPRITSSLVYSETLMFEVLSARLDPSRTRPLRDDQRDRLAFVTFMLEEELMSSHVMQFALKTRERPSPMREMDITEVAGLGLGLLIRASGAAVASASIHQFNRLSSTYRGETSLAVIARRLCEAVSGPWLSAICVPGVVEPADLNRYRLVVGTGTYGMDMLRDRTASTVYREVERQTMLAPEAIVVPSASLTYPASLVLLTALERILYSSWAMMTGPDAGVTGRDNIGTIADCRKRMESRGSEHEKLQEISATIVSLSETGSTDVRRAARECLRLTVIQLELSAEEEVRKFRRGVVRTSTARARDSLEPPTLTKRFSAERSRAHSTEWRPVELPILTERERIRDLATRSLLRGEVQDSSLVKTWNEVLRNLIAPGAPDGWTAAVIGAGAGAAMVALWQRGAAAVLGHDLAVARPDTEHRFATWRPPLVVIEDPSEERMSMTQSSMKRGDWFADGEEIMAEVWNATVLVVDLEGDQVPRNLSILQPILDSKWIGTVVFKIRGTPLERHWVTCDCAVMLGPTRCVDLIDPAGREDTRYLAVDLTPVSRGGHANVLDEPTEVRKIPVPVNEQDLEMESGLMTHPFTCSDLSGSSIEAFRAGIVSLFRRTSRDLDPRTFARALESSVALRIYEMGRSMNVDEIPEAIADILDGNEILMTEIGDLQVRVVVTQRLKSLLARTVSSALGHYHRQSRLAS